MFARRIVVISIACLAVGILAPAFCYAQRYRQSTSRTNSRQVQQKMMEERQKQFEEQAARQEAEREKWMAERQKEFEQRMKDRANGKNDQRNEAIRQALEMTEVQWKVVEPKINRIYFLQDQSQISIGAGGSNGVAYGIGVVGGGMGMGMGGFGGGAMGGAAASSSSGRSVSTETGTSTGGEWKTRSSSGGGAGGGGGIRVISGPLWRLADRELTEGEKSCERLEDLLDDKNSKDEQIEKEVAVLRQAREDAVKELAKARQELREVLTPRQQASLVLTGLLD